MLWPAVALVVSQVVHAAVPVDPDKAESESWVGFYVGIVLLLLSVAAVVGLLQRRAYGRPLATWTGLVVAVGFVAYHASPWHSPATNPYLGEPVGAPAWLSVAAAIGAGAWCAYEGRAVIRGRVAAPASP